MCLIVWFSTVSHSIQFSCSVMSDSLWPHELQHTRLPCHSLFPGVCSNSCPLSQWCHQPFYLLPPSSALNLSQPQCFFQWVGSSHQVASIGASASASVFSMNIQGWFPLGLTGLISLRSKGLSRVFSRGQFTAGAIHSSQLCSCEPLGASIYQGG